MNEIDRWEKKIICQLFWVVLNYVVIFNVKNYKNIACADFVNVITALNLHPYEELHTRFDKKDIYFVAERTLNCDHIAI